MAKNKPDKPDNRRVILTDTHLLAVGPYARDEVHEVPAELAAYLVSARGFRYVTESTPSEPTE